MALYDIPAELPFLDCLAAGVLRQAGEAPEALAEVTILLPTRRSARALRSAFLRAAGGRSLLLPRMRALAGLSTEDADELALPVLLDLSPAVETLQRQAVLTRLALRLPRRFGGPTTPEQAWQMAGELARLLDEVALEERDLLLLETSTPAQLAEHWLGRLEALVPEAHAQHWQITTTFLRGVFGEWQGWLAANGLLDIGMRRVQALRAQAAAWRDDPPQAPVIAAGIGIGGTVPAAAELLRVVAQDLPQGAVVLHGIDQDSAEALWDAIGTAPTHAYCGQQRLLQALEAQRGDIQRWPGCDMAARVPAARPALLGMALRPAEGLEAWQQRQPARWQPGLEGLSLLTASDAQQEAVAIALLLREAVEQPQARAALVTPDRDLARRVMAELARHGITADDSAGEALAQTPAGGFLRLLAQMVDHDFAPVPLLSVLKHPLCAGGWDRTRWMAAVRLLERAALRGPRPAPGLAGLRAAALAGLRGEKQAERLAEVLALLDRLEEVLGGFTLDGPPRPPADLLQAHLLAAEALAASDSRPGPLRLYAGEEGEVLAQHMAALAPAMAALPPIAPGAWASLFDAMLEGAAAPSFRGSRGRESAPHPRVEILGLLEARLLSFDRVILGALDETVWPLATDPGPWMSRPMRAQFGLPEPEARIGRVCADFLLTACAAPQAVLSRAAKRGGAPTVPARWLTRLETFLRGQTDARHAEGLRLPQSPALAWALQLDQPASVTPCTRPMPAPPPALRPRRLSLSDVELLIADPYAFYARRVLGLRVLDPLEQDIGAAEYGTLVHDALRRFLQAIEGIWPGEEAATRAWEAAAAAALEAAGPRPAIAAFWAPRLAAIGGFVITQEEALRRDGGLRRCLPEVVAEFDLLRPGGSVTLDARADRLDELANGSWRILDYKTGTLPKDKDLASGSKPQLAIEAMLLEQGGFKGIEAGAPLAALIFWRLTGGEQPGEVATMKLADDDGVPLAALARDNLAALVDDFLLGSRAFASRPHPARKPAGGDYDHLARLDEWSAAEGAAP